MKVLVTGGAGFVGSTLVDRLLAEGNDVDVIDDLSTGALRNLADARTQTTQALKFHHLDIRSPDTAALIERRQPEVVFHLASAADPQASVTDPVFDAEVNLLGLLHVLEGARRAGTAKVVFASSGGSIYGSVATTDLPVRESQPQRPLSPYGVAKKASNDYLHAYRELHQLEFTTLALGHVYGPRQKPGGEAGVIATFIAQLLDGRQCMINGDGSQTRDFVFVDDVVDAFVRSVDRAGGLLCNIATSVETSVLAVHDAVAQAVGVETAPLHVTARPGEPRRIALDSGRAAMQLGWQPWTSLADGVAQTVEWFRDQRPVSA